MSSSSLHTNTKQLYEYIENHILILYDNLDLAHNIQHIRNVMNRSIALSKFLNIDNEIVLVAAAYHDLGILFNRTEHEFISSRIFQQDSFMKERFSRTDIELISESIEDHRSSNAKRPRSIYGEILHDTDTFGGDLNELILRSIGFGKKYYPNYTKEQHFERIFSYLNQKYGDGGYAKIYIDYPLHLKNYHKIRRFLKSKKQMQKIFETIFIDSINRTTNI